MGKIVSSPLSDSRDYPHFLAHGLVSLWPLLLLLYLLWFSCLPLFNNSTCDRIVPTPIIQNHFPIRRWGEVLVAQSCPTLCDPMDCSPLGSSVHWILQARALQWVAISFFRWSSQSRDQTCISCMVGIFFTHWATWEALFPARGM